jgi:hypothetical protein
MKLTIAIYMSILSLAAETVTFPMGSAGQVVFDYRVESFRDTQYTFTALYSSRVSATALNQTGLPLHCSFSGKGEGFFRAFLYNKDSPIAPGGRASFQQETPTMRTDMTGRPVTWESHCHVGLQYIFTQSPIVRSFPGGSIAATIGRDQVDFVLRNDSDEPIEILWNESSLVDIERNVSRIFHKGIRYVDREHSLPDTTVPPQAKIDDIAVPSNNVFYVEPGLPLSGWHTKALLPVDSPVEKAQALMNRMKGAKVVLFLQLRIAGKKVSMSLPFEVASVEVK